MNRFVTRIAPVLAVAAVTAAVAATTASADPSISSKRAQAQRVLVQLRSLDASAQRANNRYQAASEKLQQLDESLKVNRLALRVARHNLGRAQVALSQRLVAIYTTRDEQSTLSVLLGARSIDDLVSRIETVNSVSKQDVAVMGEVVSFKHQVTRRERLLERAHVLQKRLVRERASAKRRVDSQVAREQRLYNSVRAEIDHLVAMEHARQLAAAQAARLRLAAVAASQGYSVGASGTVDGAAVAPPSQYGGVVGIAMRYLGVPYVWGGASPSGFDCSGLVMYVYAQVGVSLPHYSGAQWNVGVPVSRSDLQPGDLVFFDGLGHVGIYIGGGQFIHAPETGDVVKISSLDGWYAATYDGARRITG